MCGSVLASMVVFCSGCKEKHLEEEACKNISKIQGKKYGEEVWMACFKKYIWPVMDPKSLRGGDAREAKKPHLECYIEADSEAAVEKCYKAMRKAAGLDETKSRGADKARSKTRIIEGCVAQCEGKQGTEYKACFEVCKKAAGL